MPILTLTEALEYYETFAIGFENHSEHTVRIKKTAASQLIQYLGFAPPQAGSARIPQNSGRLFGHIHKALAS